jgi:hypothetical protein
MNELTMLLKEYAKNYSGEVEIIEDDDFIRALYYLDNLFINSEIDVLIYLSAMNLCNSYAKQHKEHDIYKFKKEIGTIIDILNDHNIPNVKVCMINNEGNLYIFKVNNITFSFHDEKKVEISKEYYEEMKWDGIKKQPCAKTLFDKSINNVLANRSITTTGKPISLLANKLVEDYHNKVLTFEEIIENM